MHLMHTLYNGSTQCTQAIRLNGTLNVSRLVAAVKIVKYTHEFLNVKIEECSGGLRFTAIDDDLVPVQVAERDSNIAWFNQMQRSCNSPLNVDGYLWNLLLLVSNDPESTSSDLLLTFHHAIMDGAAVEVFIDSLLTTYASLDKGHVLKSGKRQVPLAAESLLDKSMILNWDEFAEKQKQSSQVRNGGFSKHLRSAPLNSRETKSICLELDAKTGGELVTYCNERKLSLNSYLSAALLHSLARCIKDRDNFTLSTAFSLRQMCGHRLEPGELGCYIAVVGTHHRLDVNARNIDALAREHQRMLFSAVVKEAKHPTDYDLGDLKKGIRKLEDIDAFVHDAAFTLGEFKLSNNYGALSIESIYATANRSVGNLWVAVHGVKINDAIFITLNYTEPLQDGAEIMRVTEGFIETLRLTSTESNSAHGPRIVATPAGLGQQSTSVFS